MQSLALFGPLISSSPCESERESGPEHPLSISTDAPRTGNFTHNPMPTTASTTPPAHRTRPDIWINLTRTAPPRIDGGK